MARLSDLQSVDVQMLVNDIIIQQNIKPLDQRRELIKRRKLEEYIEEILTTHEQSIRADERGKVVVVVEFLKERIATLEKHERKSEYADLGYSFVISELEEVLEKLEKLSKLGEEKNES